MKFVVLGLLVLFVIGFFVVVWKAAQHWRWYNLVAAVLTMLLAVALMFPTAVVLKSRSAWHQVKESMEVRAEQVKAEQTRLKFGDPESAEAGQGIIELTRQLSKIGLEAGRRWRSMQLQDVAEQSITLALPPPPAGIPGQEGDQAGPAASTDPLAPEQLVVYGFAEAPNEQQILVPSFYLGEFVVTASTPTSITIEPTAPLEEAQSKAIEDRQATSWSLYELLPLDGHEMFVATGSASSDEQFLGRVDDELVKKLLGDRVSPETLQKYLRDGSRATQSDPPLSRWTKIEFDKSHAFEVDSKETRSALDGGFFDGVGRAVDGRLQKGEDVKFKKGDQIVIKEEEANRLISEGVAQLVDRYFLRPLNDYRYVLRRIRLRLTQLSNRMTDMQYEREVLQAAADKTQQMLVTNQDIKLKLEQDFAHFRKEKQVIQKYADELRDQAAKMRAEMKRLHAENIALEQRLEAQYRRLGAGNPAAMEAGVAAVR